MLGIKKFKKKSNENVEHYAVGTANLKDKSVLDKRFSFDPVNPPLMHQYATGTTDLDVSEGVPAKVGKPTLQQINNMDFSNYYKV